MPLSAKRKGKEGLSPLAHLVWGAATALTLLLCLCLGSVSFPPAALWAALGGEGTAASILFTVRLPRILCVGLSGAALSLCGCAMQGLLRNPLADGSTLGVSAGASLGAVLFLALGVTLPGLANTGLVGMAVLFAFLSLCLILSLAYRLDCTLSTNTIILIGVIFTMFANSIISLLTVFAGERVRTILFWTMGSLAGRGYGDAALLLGALCLCGGLLLLRARELDALAVGEDNARGVGVNVRRVKLEVLAAVSALTGVCVAVGGTIAFVGLVTPHAMRILLGPSHRRLLGASMWAGAVFLPLCDLLCRLLLPPLELPIGVVTSFVGSLAFVYIFARGRRT